MCGRDRVSAACSAPPGGRVRPSCLSPSGGRISVSCSSPSGGGSTREPRGGRGVRPGWTPHGLWPVTERVLEVASRVQCLSASCSPPSDDLSRFMPGGSVNRRGLGRVFLVPTLQGGVPERGFVSEGEGGVTRAVDPLWRRRFGCGGDSPEAPPPPRCARHLPVDAGAEAWSSIKGPVPVGSSGPREHDESVRDPVLRGRNRTRCGASLRSALHPGGVDR